MNKDGFHYTFSARLCIKCGQAPDISRTESPMFFDSPAYEMFCTKCHTTSGRWPNPEEARWSWDRINTPMEKKEEDDD